MEVTAVASQWQAVSGAGISSLARPAAESLSSRSQFGNPRLVQARRRDQMTRRTGGPLVLAMAEKKASSEAPVTPKKRSILCQECDGNGAVVCSQCKGGGMNTEDHFGGRFKAGTICWLCRGKKQMLCGNCNGAGFLGGFLNTQDE